jgi:two-component system nitrogen regulation sensor histidine kinase NtrY
MTLRTKILLYFVALHVVVAGCGVVVLMEKPLLLFVVEVLFALSVYISYRLVRALFVPLDLLRTGAELIGERDFTSRFSAVGQPEMDALVSIYNTMIDRLREERLGAEERHQLLQKIVQASPSGIVICDFDGKMEQVNPAAERLLRDDLLSDLVGMRSGESRLVVLDGTRRVRIKRAEFRDRGFAKAFFLLEELTEELRVSEKAAYEKLIRMVSHEVNNSVGAVRSLLGSLLRYECDVRSDDREDYRMALTVASSRIDALNRFVRDFAEVVRIPLPHRVPVQADDLVREIATLVRPDLDRRRIALALDLDAGPLIRADRSQFEQVLLNVVRNAAEAIGEEGSIAISLREGMLSVTDSGHGIPEDARGELFSPFFTTKRDGRGLGLTIVREILTNHGFAYSLENRSEGGAEFRTLLAERGDGR